MAGSAPALAADLSDDAPNQSWALHGQVTVVDQGHPAFAAPYAGADSLSADATGRETVDVTLFAGIRPWSGAELWINPEIDQGFGLNDTLGIAAFPSAEAYKVGRSSPYFRLQRLFLRQTIDLGGPDRRLDPDLNQLGRNSSENRLVIWLGKLSVVDIFDTNDFAHDSKHDFLNWGLIDAATFDYAADAWGYTDGAAAEWYQEAWTWRAGLFDLSDVPNSERLDARFDQFQMIGEIERRFTVAGRAGAAKVTAFLSRGRMGLYDDAVALAERTGASPSVSLVRRYRSRTGISVDLQQQLTEAVGMFARLGAADGDVEPYEFTDIDRTASAGLTVKGAAWRRPGDTWALAGEVNGASNAELRYLAAGGLGILVGDGRLPHPGAETILETWYDVPVGRFAHLTADYQFVDNPAFNRDRGPVSIFALRLHAQF